MHVQVTALASESSTLNQCVSLISKRIRQFCVRARESIADYMFGVFEESKQRRISDQNPLSIWRTSIVLYMR